MADDIRIKIMQNVRYTLVCETDNKIEISKDAKIKISNAETITITWSEFHTVANRLVSPITYFSKFNTNGWACDPSKFCCTSHTMGILFFIYYTKNFTLFKNFFKFLMGKESFDFGGRKYIVTNFMDYPADLRNEEPMKKFLFELEKYCDEKLIPDCFTKKEVVDKWIADNKYMFDTVSNAVPAIKLCFESDKMSSAELLIYSRYFMNSLVTDYYHQNIDSIGNKISIYQLQIRYDIVIRKKENPKYAKWEEKYGDPNETSDKKENDKSNENPQLKEKSNEDTKNTENNKTTTGSASADNAKPSTNPKRNSPNNAPQRHRFAEGGPDDSYEYYSMAHNNGYQRIPPKPEKFIEEEIKVPIAESIHIKSDKKPFQYLYLQKSQKELLESYLANFKNNRELYDKMGILYKAGICLSGLPGCGKTSTIMAIATYLNKDIYYLDLGKIKTNNELKLCIDYVKTNSQRGGIIIFEDIDCSTDIVKCRSNTNDIITENNITKVVDSQNDKLSLSFLLNILDGTMSPEDIIFIFTTNHKEKLDPALIRPGRMDIDIVIEKCCRYQLQQIYFDLYGKHLKEELLNKFIEFRFMTAEVILHLFHNIYNKNITEDELLKKFLE